MLPTLRQCIAEMGSRAPGHLTLPCSPYLLCSFPRISCNTFSCYLDTWDFRTASKVTTDFRNKQEICVKISTYKYSCFWTSYLRITKSGTEERNFRSGIRKGSSPEAGQAWNPGRQSRPQDVGMHEVR